MRGLFGRRAELEAIFSALGGGLPVEIIGHPGIGKTALLRSLAYHPEAAAFVDGVIYLTARQQRFRPMFQRPCGHCCANAWSRTAAGASGTSRPCSSYWSTRQVSLRP